jgi:uncharacterized protein YndB with AHSA1/START domain
MASRILVSLRIKARPERAFEAFTKEISLWWRPNTLFAFTPREPGILSFEPGEGGRLIETRNGGKIFEVGKIRVWSPPLRLVFGWRQASFTPEQLTEVEVSFEPVGEETRVTVEHHGWDTVPTAHVARHGFENSVFLRRHGEWWQTLLVAFKVSVGEDQAS